MKWTTLSAFIIIVLIIACGDPRKSEAKIPPPLQNSPPLLQPTLISTLAPKPEIPREPPSQNSDWNINPNLPEFDLLTSHTGVAVEFGCAPIMLIQATQGALTNSNTAQFKNDIENKYPTQITGNGITHNRLQAIANVLSKVPTNAIPKTIYLYASYEDFVKGRGYTTPGPTKTQAIATPAQGIIRISPATFAETPKFAMWVIAHEFGHISHGEIGDSKTAESIADAFATKYLGYTGEQARRTI